MIMTVMAMVVLMLIVMVVCHFYAFSMSVVIIMRMVIMVTMMMIMLKNIIFRRIVLHNRVIESWRKENEKAKEGPRHQGVDCHDYYLGNNCVTEIVTTG